MSRSYKDQVHYYNRRHQELLSDIKHLEEINALQAKAIRKQDILIDKQRELIAVLEGKATDV
jgi:hypothetical protein